MFSIEMKYHPEDWCEDINDCEDKCEHETKKNEKDEDKEKDKCDYEIKDDDKHNDKDCKKKKDEKHNDKDKCNCEKKKDDKNKDNVHFEKKQPYDSELVEVERDNLNIKSCMPKEWHCE